MWSEKMFRYAANIEDEYLTNEGCLKFNISFL